RRQRPPPGVLARGRRGGRPGAGAAVPRVWPIAGIVVRATTSRNAERPPMKLEGIHHITAITGDAPGNVDFYTRVLGLRMAAKTVNQDDPGVYHLFYADE